MSGDTGSGNHDRPEFPDRRGEGDHPGGAEERRRAEEGRRAAHSVSGPRTNMNFTAKQKCIQKNQGLGDYFLRYKLKG